MPAVAAPIRCTFHPLEPTLALALAASADDKATWLCVAKVGDYWHPQFKEFGLTSNDFTTMVKTFKGGIYPESPAQLPCDYDHRSLRAKTPEDGKAAGWIQDLETRDQGTTLWAKVEFTPPAIVALQNKEWRFLSGVFAPRWRTFRKQDLGPTFLGLAITNYPTLHNLPAIALGGAVIPMHASDRFADTLALADLSFDDKRQRLQEAVKARYGDSLDGDYVWIQAVYDEYLVVQRGRKSYKLTYTITDDGVVTLGADAVEVVVQFEPIAASRPPKEPSMAGKPAEKKPDAQTITVKTADGQEVTIPLSSLATVEEVLALGRAQAPAAPDPATVVARTDFDALHTTVTQLSTELKAEREKREALEAKDRERTVKEWIRTGQIFPKEEALALSNFALFAGLVAERGTVVTLNREQGSGSRGQDEPGGYTGSTDVLHAKALEYSATHKVGYAEAVIAVSTTTASEAVTERALALRREHAI